MKRYEVHMDNINDLGRNTSMFVVELVEDEVNMFKIELPTDGSADGEVISFKYVED